MALLSNPRVTVVGAAGHTGRLTVHTLASAGYPMTLVGRNDEALTTLASELPAGADVVAADARDFEAIVGAARASDVVVNCAGPYRETAPVVVAAALDAQCHYVDHSAEPDYVRHLYEEFAPRSMAAGRMVVPGLSFFGGLGDLVAARAARDVASAADVTVAYALDRWPMTRASKSTALRLIATERLVYEDERLRAVQPEHKVSPYEFAAVGTQPVVENYPGTETVTIPTHLHCRSVRVLVSAGIFQDETTFTSEDAPSSERAATQFTVEARVIAHGDVRRSWVSGTDIYATGARLLVASLPHMLDRDQAAGVLAPAEVVDVDALLASLFEVHDGAVVSPRLEGS